MEVTASDASGRPKVLIGFGDAIAAPEAAWSLLDAGYRVSSFTRPGQVPPVARCHGVELVRVAAPEVDADATARDLRELVGSGSVSAVLPLDDRAIWVCDRALSGTGASLVGPAGDLAELALDKRLQLEEAESAGFDCLPARVVDRETDLLQTEDFPVVVKPVRPIELIGSALHRGSNVVCANRAELEAAAGTWGERQSVLVQRFVRGTGEGLFGLAGHEGVTSWSAHRRIRMMNPAGSAASACVSRPVDPELVERAETFVKRTGWLGPFMMEFIRDVDGKQWFLELNGRLWGSLALSRRARLEYAAWAVHQALDPSFVAPSPAVPEGIVCRRLGAELAHLGFVLRGPRSSALAPAWPTRISALRSVLAVRRSDHWYNCRRGNESVMVADTIQCLTSLAKALVRSAWL
jgi:hypothetical protein